MSKVNLLKPNKENINLFLGLGALFFILGILDFSLNNFYEKKEPGFNSKEEIKTDFIGSIKESQSIKDINRYSLPPLSLLINSQKEKYDTN